MRTRRAVLFGNPSRRAKRSWSFGMRWREDARPISNVCHLSATWNVDDPRGHTETRRPA